MGQGMAESAARANAARYAAQGNPQFSDPALQAIVKDFEARYAEIGLDAEKLGMAQSKPSPVTKETAFQVLKGMSYEQCLDSQAEVARTVPGYTALQTSTQSSWSSWPARTEEHTSELQTQMRF